MKLNRVQALVCFVAGVLPIAASAAAVRLINHQPFCIRMPFEVPDPDFRVVSGSTSAGSVVQRDGSNLVFIAEIPANRVTDIDFVPTKTVPEKPLVVGASSEGVRLFWCGANAGELSWSIVVQPGRQPSSDSNVGTKADFAKHFEPVRLVFHTRSWGQVFDVWEAEGVSSGLRLAVELKVFHEGFLDITARVANESAPESKVYAAVVCRWQQPDVERRVVSYDNRRTDFGPAAWTSFRSDEARHWHMGHGVDWVRSDLSDGSSIVWLNAFNPSFTVEVPATAKTPARYTGANQAQLAHEVQTARGALLSVTEIARPMIKSLRDRYRENVLPLAGEAVSISSRVVFSRKRLSDDEADNVFVGYTGYREQHGDSANCDITCGVGEVRFGTSYFPYSTLGENFDSWKLPGMDREGFWPLAADTVTQWKLFADDIRRDLRLAKWMGFKLIRLHHLELLATLDKSVRQEYLDFIFGELRHLQLKALLDVYASPAQIQELLRRYGDVVDAVEVENEVLIWGIPLDRPAEWKQFYDAIKAVAPHVRVHWTGQNNTGIFDRLARLGVNFDRIGLHAYVDSVDALPSGRGWALAAASYGTRAGKAPVITEWNWRNLTRMLPEQRAKVYPQVIEAAVATRSIPDFYEFQFNETLAPNPRIGRGNLLRHYELINLSRHPKPEAFELARIIRQYAGPNDPLRQLAVGYTEAVLDEKGTASAAIVITNVSGKPMQLQVSAEAPKALALQLSPESKFSLAAGQTKTVPIGIAATEKKPGIYHGFVRFDGPNGFLRYAVIEARLPGKPVLDVGMTNSAVQYPRGVREEADLPLGKLATVVYGQDAPVIEVETAFAIAQTLEAATGQPVRLCQLNDLPVDAIASGNLILVGTPASHSLINRMEPKLPLSAKSYVVRLQTMSKSDWLIVGGIDSESAEKAGMDLILRYWKGATASAASRVGLTQKELPRGIDPAKLP